MATDGSQGNLNYPVTETEEGIRGAAIPSHTHSRQPSRAALRTDARLSQCCGNPSDRSLQDWIVSNSSCAGWMRDIASLGSILCPWAHSRSRSSIRVKSSNRLILMNAAAWICAHNHPSDDPAPSEEDRQLTIRLKQGADLLGIPLLDHLVLADARCYSFADHGWPGA